MSKNIKPIWFILTTFKFIRYRMNTYKEGAVVVLKYIFSFVIFFIIVGCQSNSKEEGVSNVSDSSLFLAINSVITSNVPIAINQKIILDFSASLDQETINNDAVYILDNVSGEPIATNISLLENTSSLEFTPYTYLRANHNYTIVVTTVLQDLQGRSLSQDYHFSFKTLNETINDSPLLLRSLKPQPNSTGVLPDSNIVLDFSKNLSLDAQFSSSSYLEVIDDDSKEPIAGTTEVFNSLLIFKPLTLLPVDTNISVKLMNSPTDIYGRQSYDISQQQEWRFTTRTSGNTVDQNNTGYKVLASYSSTNEAFHIEALENDSNTSQVVIATTNRLELLDINYTDANGKVTKPTVTLLDTYIPSSSVVSIATKGRDLYVALSDNNISIFRITQSSFDLNSSISAQHPIYKVTITPSNKMFALEPGFGFEVFTNDENGLLVQNKQIENNKTVYLDAIEGSYYDDNAKKDVTQFYLADYAGGVDTYDANISFVYRTDINGSVKFLVPFESYNATGSILAINSSGKIQEVDSNGSLGNMQAEIVSKCYDVNTLHDPYDESFNIIYSLGNKGVYHYNEGYDAATAPTSDNNGFSINKFSTSTEIISNVTVENPLNQGQSFLLTLDRTGFLYISNFITDTDAPYISYTHPYQGGTITTDENISIEIRDNYLDNTTIDKGTFSFYDRNSTTSVAFNLSSDYPGDLVLDPIVNLIDGHQYTITIDKNVSDMLGNVLPKGSEVINFTATQ